MITFAFSHCIKDTNSQLKMFVTCLLFAILLLSGLQSQNTLKLSLSSTVGWNYSIYMLNLMVGISVWNTLV